VECVRVRCVFLVSCVHRFVFFFFPSAASRRSGEAQTREPKRARAPALGKKNKRKMNDALAAAAALADDPAARQATYEAALASAAQAKDVGALTAFVEHGEERSGIADGENSTAARQQHQTTRSRLPPCTPGRGETGGLCVRVRGRGHSSVDAPAFRRGTRGIQFFFARARAALPPLLSNPPPSSRPSHTRAHTPHHLSS
jgi:hypothetical protein